jgi:hypothetical protein
MKCNGMSIFVLLKRVIRCLFTRFDGAYKTFGTKIIIDLRLSNENNNRFLSFLSEKFIFFRLSFCFWLKINYNQKDKKDKYVSK